MFSETKDFFYNLKKKTLKARVHAGETAEKQLAFLWARSLGGESALKLLNRLGHLNDVIDIAAQNSAFDFAFELARGAGVGSQVKLDFSKNGDT